MANGLFHPPPPLGETTTTTSASVGDYGVRTNPGRDGLGADINFT